MTRGRPRTLTPEQEAAAVALDGKRRRLQREALAAEREAFKLIAQANERVQSSIAMRQAAAELSQSAIAKRFNVAKRHIVRVFAEHRRAS